MDNQRKAILFGLLAVLSWSTVATAFKLALQRMDHFQLLFLAVVFSLLSLGIVLIFQGRSGLLLKAGPRQWLICAGLGLLNPFFLLSGPVQGLCLITGSSGPTPELHLGTHPGLAGGSHSGAEVKTA